MVETGITKQENTQLAKFEMDALELMIPAHKELVRAKYEPRVSTYKEFQQIDYMKVIVKELIIHTDSNHMKLDPVPFETMVQSLAVMAVSELRSLSHKYTLTEARIALREGYRGSFKHICGEIIGLSAVNFNKCFKSYEHWEVRLNAQKEFHKAIDHPTTDKPVTDMFKVSMEIAEACFETFKAEPKAMKGTVYATETGSFHLPTIFNFLVDNFHVLPFSPESEAAVKKQAKTDYWEFINTGLSRADRKAGKLDQLIKSVKLEENRTYEYYCDAEGLRVLFTKLIERQKTLTYLKKKVCIK